MSPPYYLLQISHFFSMAQIFCSVACHLSVAVHKITVCSSVTVLLLFDIMHAVHAGLNGRLSGSASNLALAGKSPLTTARTRGLSADKTGRAGQRNGLVAKSWSDLSLNAVNNTPSPRDSGLFSLHMSSYLYIQN